jgi:hypothetical protein
MPDLYSWIIPPKNYSTKSFDPFQCLVPCKGEMKHCAFDVTPYTETDPGILVTTLAGEPWRSLFAKASIE